MGNDSEHVSTYLHDEIKELYNFCRHDFRLFVTWYTAFTTVNYIAIGWVISSDVLNNNSFIIIAISVFMISQNIFAIKGSTGLIIRWATKRERSQHPSQSLGIIVLILKL